MRPGNNNNRRGRNRGQRKPHGGMPNKSQNFDNGAETRVRGNVYQVLEKYLQLARDAGVAGDRVAAENFLQHADHYYRVVMAMNDGQRPRIGGREISVADVNVQNVSQGLSAALYSGGPSQPNMSDNAGNQAQSQGNGGQRNENFNGQGGNAGNGQGNAQGEDGQGDDGQGDDGQDGDHQGEGEGGNYQRRPQQGQGRDRDRDRNRQRRDFRQNDGQRDNRDNRQNDGQRDNRHNDNRNDNRQADGRQGDGRQGDGRQNDGRQGEFRDRGNNNQPPMNEQQPELAAAPAPAPQVADEQPDYPEHLLPPAAEAPAEAPRAAKTPRPRQQRARRPRAAEGDGEATTEAVPAAEVSE